jgi:hypothetical protein
MRTTICALVVALALAAGAALPVLGSSAVLAHKPVPAYFGPGNIDLCNWQSIEAHAEEHSRGHADKGFDRIGYPGYAGKSGRDPLQGNDCYDID